MKRIEAGDIYCFKTGEPVKIDLGKITNSMEEGDASILLCSECGFPLFAAEKMGRTAMGVSFSADHRFVTDATSEEPPAL